MSHCWTGRADTDETWRREVYLLDEDVADETCMLEDGHAGPHAWTSDRDIGVTFTEGEQL